MVVDYSQMPSVSPFECHKLPWESGLYFFADIETLLYVGKAFDLRSRLTSHHRLTQLKAHEGAIVFYQRYPKLDLEARENELIRLMKPAWNNTRVPDAYKRFSRRLKTGECYSLDWRGK